MRPTETPFARVGRRVWRTVSFGAFGGGRIFSERRLSGRGLSDEPQVSTLRPMRAARWGERRRYFIDYWIAGRYDLGSVAISGQLHRDAPHGKSR